ncbi:MAG: bifunctional riboflavin kinase/FAD synthetase [Bacteroidetes bacterium]|nr:bifunctional riboflavin kinase/FAD synthetase [Bacteroidota bacterium]MBV6462203.1 Riboflavin biosynthesis protein RibF [Flavobacteriales bacterium]MCL4816013.1 bifunctional riboflavin kinase/FAD synthetase [Flavobacteriales bacterium]GIK69731.1 MAG: riboflavin biosynthesis protein [Bacteroidota bacterium]
MVEKVKVYRNISEVGFIENAVVTTGTFDGVHLGHQKIIHRLNEVAESVSGQSVVFTFFPHPRMVLYPDDYSLQLLSTLEEKIGLLEKAGVQHLIIHPFDRAFSKLSSIEFVRDVLVNKLRVKKLVIGYNHQFGRNREGTYKHLKEFSPVYGFEVEEIPAKDVDNVNISSTKIREALNKGEVKVASAFLGRPYELSGVVVEGNKLGRTMGFPTANIFVNDKHKMIPADGVYAVRVLLENEQYKGMLNIGFGPTVQFSEKKIEVHLFNFSGDIYNKKVKVEFIEKLRDEKNFGSVEKLKEQLIKDAEIAQKI